MSPGFVAVHVGAGYHGENLRNSYMKTCKKACSSALQKLEKGCGAVEIVTQAVSVLEDCPLTNAGIGSNLTIKGTVECDAGVMDGSSLNFGSVGALSNIRNPVKVAAKLLEQQNKGLLSCGRIPPCTLVSEGALEWAQEHGFSFTQSHLFSTRSSEKSYLKNMKLINGNVSESESDLSKVVLDSSSYSNKLMDTVGAVCVDSLGNVASAVSSGGLLLKHPGRIGQAAVYGSGCWAQNSVNFEKPSIACTATGAGEYLIKTSFAKECYKMLFDYDNYISALPDVFKSKYLQSPFLKSAGSKIAGVLCLKYYSSEKCCELSWAHNTKTMILGYGSTSAKKPVSLVSFQPEKCAKDQSVVGSEVVVRLH